MLAFFYNIKQPFGLLLLSSLITVFVFLIIPFVGYIFDKIEAWEMRGMSRIIPDKVTIFFANRLTIFGTIVHEISHAVFAHLTGAKVTKISVFDIFKNGMLGHVEYYETGNKVQRSFQSTLTACAPIIGGSIMLFILVTILRSFCYSFWHYALVIFLIISVVNHLSMSPQDIFIYKRGLWIVVPTTILVLTLILYLLQPTT